MESSIRIIFHTCLNKKTIKRSLFYGLFVFTSACSQSQYSAQELLSQAKQHQADGEYKSAVIQLKNLLSNNPYDPNVRYLLGQIYLEMGQVASAEKELKKALELNANSHEIRITLARFLLQVNKLDESSRTLEGGGQWPSDLAIQAHTLEAQAYLLRGDMVEAEAALAQAMQISANDVEVQLTQAMIYFKQKNTDKAEGVVAQLLLHNPADPKALVLAGNLARYKGDYDRARLHLEQAVAIQPDNISLRVSVAQLALADNQQDQAVEQLNVVLSRSPRHPDANYLMADISLKKNAYADALEYTDQVLSYAEEHAPSHYIAAVAAYSLNQFERAHSHISVVTQRAPISPSALKLKAAVEFKLNLIEDAMSTLAQIDNEDFQPEDSSLLVSAGDAYFDGAQYELSRQLFQRAVRLNANDDTVKMKEVSASLALRDDDAAISALTRMTEQSPQSELAGMALMASHLHSGEEDKVISLARQWQEKHPQSAHGFTMEGLALALTNQLDLAEAAFRRALTVAPGDPSASQNLAVLAIQEGKFAKARGLFEGVIAKHPNNERALLGLFALEQQAGNLEQALIWLQQAVVANPKALEPPLVLSQFYLDLNRPIQALAVAETALVNLPDNPKLLLLSGQAQKLAGRYSHAVSTLGALISVEPDNLLANYHLADIYEKSGQFRLAQKYIDKTLDLNPDHLASLLVLGRIKLKNGSIDDAKAALARLKKQTTDNLLVKEFEAQIALSTGHAAEAVGLYQDVLKQHKSSATTLQLAAAQWNSGDKEAGISTLSRWLVEYPQDMIIHHLLANYYLIDNQQDKARKAFRDIVELTPDNVWAQNSLAWFLHQQGALDEALGHAKKARELAPTNAEVMDTLGMILLDKGDARAALKLIGDAASRLPESSDLQYHLALAKVKNGHIEDAKAILTRALGKADSTTPFASREDAERLLSELERADS